MGNLVQYILHPGLVIGSYRMRRYEKWMPSRMYLKFMYYATMKQKLKLNPPVLYNEKIQWLKLYDNKPEYASMVDKHEVKEFVRKRLGGEYVVPEYGVWDSFDEIDFEKLPEQFVLKCTHDSASYAICTDKQTFDIAKTREKINACLKRNFYYIGRELQYKEIKPRIIAEAYLEDHRYHELRDYKFFTFGGVPKIVHIVSNRQNPDEPTYGDFFDMDYGHLDLTMGHDNAPIPPEKPLGFEDMKRCAAILSEGIPHCRVDFYEVDGHVYFGELTFRQDSGFAEVKPERWNRILGDWINLEDIKV